MRQVETDVSQMHRLERARAAQNEGRIGKHERVNGQRSSCVLDWRDQARDPNAFQNPH